MEKVNVVERQIEVGGVIFNFIKTQREGDSHIYKSDDKTKVLRIGEKSKIERDLAKHKSLLAQGYPVASILEEGEIDGQEYFIEESLGEELFGEIFKKDFETFGKISEEHFQILLNESSKMLKAQIANSTTEQKWDEVLAGLHVDWLIQELPDQEGMILKRVETCRERLKNIPFVFSHGDFNPYNFFPKGAIDFEDGFYAPVGFDVLGLMVYPEYFPHKDVVELEINGGYKYSKEQVERYMQTMNAILVESNLPSVEEIYEEIRFLKGIWLTVKMHRWPKMQQYRYELFKTSLSF